MSRKNNKRLNAKNKKRHRELCQRKEIEKLYNESRIDSQTVEGQSILEPEKKNNEYESFMDIITEYIFKSN